MAFGIPSMQPVWPPRTKLRGSGWGLDAVEVSFLSSFSQIMLRNQSVQVTVRTLPERPDH